MRRKETGSRLAEPLILVLVPNRELAIQIFDEARRLCYRTGLRPCVAYGGSDVVSNLKQLADGCDVLIATPGKLADLMKKPHVLSMSRVKYARKTINQCRSLLIKPDTGTQSSTRRTNC